MAYVAEKGNKVYDIDKSQIEAYVAQGFDILEDGKVVKSGTGKSISAEEYDKVVEENKKLNTEIKKLKQAAKAGE
ncbi:hypothetical protein ACQ7BN_08285 [Streptococcus suis]|uniref:hypothetical protein n=1 Tax=Streptococcus suis TaxID=1307 RepID=UPI003D36A47B|nr:hypothetical protein [Streptococcus suis]MCK3937241.1 hypothetical protein [Streptococcus suis]